MPLDETALRRADFKPGRAVTLADGQAWTFPLPVLVMVPADNEAGFEVAAPGDETGEYGRLYQRWYETDDGLESLGLILKMARLLLRRNYDLTTAQLAQILRFAMSEWDEDGQDMARAVRDVCTGRGPKPSAAGDE